MSNKNELKLKVDKLKDGVEIIRDKTIEEENEVNEKEVLSDNDLKKLVEFTTGIKEISPEDIDDLRNNDVELERLLNISIIKARNFTYNPKKDFGVKYKKKRNKKNKMAKASRRNNWN